METDPPARQSTPASPEAGSSRSTGNEQPVNEERVSRLIHEEVAAAVVTVLAQLTSGPDPYIL